MFEEEILSDSDISEHFPEEQDQEALAELARELRAGTRCAAAGSDGSGSEAGVAGRGSSLGGLWGGCGRESCSAESCGMLMGCMAVPPLLQA